MNSDDGCAILIGLAVIGGVFIGLIALAVAALQAYASHMSAGSTTLGGVLGAPAGAAAGCLLGLLIAQHKKLAQIGPLPYLQYARKLSTLRKIFLNR